MDARRWNDDRIDDLMTLVRANDARIDRLDRLTDAHDEQLRDISRTGDRRSSDRRAIYLMLAAILVTQAVQIIVQIISHLAHLS